MRSPVSIVIPTFGRLEVLWNTLGYLAAQIRENDEILLIDQNSPPLAIPQNLLNLPIQCLALPKPSLTKARNFGLIKARHDWIIFLDDDIIPDPDLIHSMVFIAQKNPGCIATGRIEQADQNPNLRGVGFIDLRSGEIRTDYHQPIRGEIPFFPGGLFILRKSDLPRGMGFCPSFRGASQGEEIDFALRAKKIGMRIISDPDIFMTHLKSATGGCRSEEFRSRFFRDELHNRALFYGRHGQWFYALSFLKRTKDFMEFHTRKPGKGHSWILMGAASRSVLMGGVMGILLRLQDYFKGAVYR